MNLVGKIFTVLILIMSVSFMMIAVTVFATHRNWRDVVMGPNGLKAQIEARSETNRQLRAEAERKQGQLAIEQAARRTALAALQSQVQTISQELERAVTQAQELQATNGSLVETVNTNGMNLRAKSEEVDELRGRLREAQQARDDIFNAVVVLTDQVNSIEGTLESLRERNSQLEAEKARMRDVLARNDLDEFMPIAGIPPRVDGVVTAVGRTDLIEISLGSDDGLRKGHTLEVFRNNDYLGKVRVQSIEPDKAVGKVLPGFRQGIIRRGDRVATKFS